jgi:hypothetical protein
MVKPHKSDISMSNPSTRSSNTVELSPKQRGNMLRALAEFQTELFRVEAGFLPGLRRWELKREMAELIFRDARRVQELRVRCRELGGTFLPKHTSQAAAGRKLIEALCHAKDAEAAFSATFALIKPRLRRVIHSCLHVDLRVYDAPSIPVLQDNLAELDRQLTWAQQQPEYQAVAPSDWRHLISNLADGLEEGLADRPSGAEPTRTGRRIGTLPIPRSAIPEGFKEIVSGTPASEGTDYSHRGLYHAHNFLMEIQASESCASLLFEAPDMPWEFYFDLSRHMWDEMRHCEFGELKLRSLGRDIREMGLSNTAYVLRQTIDPLDRYAALTTQEADAFPGKHAGLKDSIENDDAISARAWSYDIADETQHVRYGQRWIPVMIQETGEPRSYEQLKRDAENWRRDVLAAVYAPSARSFAQAT